MADLQYFVGNLVLTIAIRFVPILLALSLT